MNRKQKIGYYVAHGTKVSARSVKNVAVDSVNGAGLLLRFAKRTVQSAARSVRNGAADIAQGAKYGWKAD